MNAIESSPLFEPSQPLVDEKPGLLENTVMQMYSTKWPGLRRRRWSSSG